MGSIIQLLPHYLFKKSGAATLTLDFFKAVADKLLAVFAIHENKKVAAAICFEGKDKLYGRHWGCHDNYKNLHFEVCYYTGIDYCIEVDIHASAYIEYGPGDRPDHVIQKMVRR